MSSKIIMAILMLIFVPVPGTQNRNQNQQDCRDIEIQLASCKQHLNSCGQQLKQANGDCQDKLQELRKELNQQAEAKYGQLKTELASAQSDLRKSHADYNQLKQELTSAQSNLRAVQTKYETLQQDLTRSEKSVGELRMQNAQLKTSYDAQLAERQAIIEAKNRELGDKNAEIISKNKQISGLNSQNVNLAGQVSALGQSLKSVEQAKMAADQAKSDLQANLDRLSVEERKKPEVVMALIQDYQKKMDQSGAPVAITQGKDGSIRRELVIGTLEVKPYPAEIPADGKLQLIAIFTPRPLPGGLAGDTLWYVNLAYNPPPGINAVYNQKESLGEETREVHLGTDHKWVWLVDGATNSQALAATQMDILAGFQRDKVDRIAGQPVVLTRAKSPPGWFAVAFESVKSNLSYILATITTLFGIWAGYLTLKLKKVELAKTEKAETPAS